MAAPLFALDHESLNFSSQGSLSSFTVKSQSDKRTAFKVKVSNFELFRVKPVYGFIDPKGNQKIEVLRLVGTAKEDKLVVQYAEVPSDENDPAGAFKAGAEAGEVTCALKVK